MQSFSLGPYQVHVLRRSFQRSLTLRVPSLGVLKVSCGKSVPVREVIRFLHEKMDFIENCHRVLEEQKSKRSLQNFTTGEKCPFLGVERELDVQVVPQLKRGKVQLESGKLVICVAQDKHTKEQLAKFLKKSGANYLGHLVSVRAKQMNLFPKRLSFRSQRTRWGSCSSQGSISLNWRLIAGSHEVMDYVVVHELAHLKHHDHSKAFWNLVEEFCPDYRIHQQWLKSHHYLFDFF